MPVYVLAEPADVSPLDRKEGGCSLCYTFIFNFFEITHTSNQCSPQFFKRTDFCDNHQPSRDPKRPRKCVYEIVTKK